MGLVSIPHFLLGLSVNEYINPGVPDESILPNTWTANGAGVTFTDNLITFSSAVDGVTALQIISSTTIDGPFVVSITVESITTGSITLGIESDPSVSSAGTFTYPISRLNGQFIITSSLSNAVISRVSIRQLTDAQLGVELCTNGTFDSSTGWTQTPDSPGTPWQIADGKLSAIDTNNGGYITSSTAPIISGGLYKLVIAMTSNPSASEVDPFICTAPDVFNGGFTGIRANAANMFTGYGKADNSGSLALYGGYALLSIESISLRKYALS